MRWLVITPSTSTILYCVCVMKTFGQRSIQQTKALRSFCPGVSYVHRTRAVRPAAP